MYKRIFFAALLFSSAAFAQQVDIAGKDFLSGAGDARLADIARQAAAQGKRLVVTAPPYWQGKVADKLHAGAANVEVQMKEGFFENVLVRIEDAKPAAAKAEAPKTEAAKPDTAKADAAKAEAAKAEAARAAAAKSEAERAEAARLEAERAAAARIEAERAAKEAAARAEAARIEAEKEAAAKAAAAKAEAEKAAAKAAADHVAQIRQRMEKNLNEGKPAEGALTVAQLQKDDQLFVDDGVRGVVRLSGAHRQLFWLEGELNLERVELVPVGEDHYKIAEPIRETANPVLRTRGLSGHFVGRVPAADAAERKTLQDQYAEGREVTETLHPADLRAGDVVFTGQSAAVVVRRSGTLVSRFWLDGDLNLAQTGLTKQAANAYRVLSDTIK